MALKGIDISHHNKWMYDHKQVDISKNDFVIIKATEGMTFVDPMYDDYMAEIKRLNKPYGLYHYARPENNKPEQEARHFCECVGTDAVNAIIALDWEGKATSYDVNWAVEWLKYVENVYGKKPLIYCSSWYTSKLKPVYDNGNGLWVAHYTKAKKPVIHTYPFWAIWQYTSEPYDKDIFNGDLSQWLKYT